MLREKAEIGKNSVGPVSLPNAQGVWTKLVQKNYSKNMGKFFLIFTIL